jgi:hypothetical protein
MQCVSSELTFYKLSKQKTGIQKLEKSDFLPKNFSILAETVWK